MPKPKKPALIDLPPVEVKRTPMLDAYESLKRTLPPDTLLLFKLGDFYEAFDDDAKTLAKTLNIALTKRGTAPMAGIPYHAFDSNCRTLLKAGYRVATCEGQQLDQLLKGGKNAQ